MNRASLKQQLKELDIEIETALASRSNSDRLPIFDGAINLDEYLNSDVRVLWLMKEPYDEEDGCGGGWSFSEKFLDPSFVRDLVFGSPKTTWQPVTYVSYGIQNNLFWDDMKYIRQDHGMMEALRSIAWVNIQKLPSLNHSRTDMTDVTDCYACTGHLIRKQIELLDPHVIICGNTLDVIKIDCSLGIPERLPGVDLYSWGCRWIVHAYHPAQRTLSRQLYVDSIIGAVKKVAY